MCHAVNEMNFMTQYFNTFGISRPEGPQPLGGRNFQITVTFELADQLRLKKLLSVQLQR